jgi:hypothetical protein
MVLQGDGPCHPFVVVNETMVRGGAARAERYREALTRGKRPRVQDRGSSIRRGA